jgi:hypothetical protein
MVVARGDIALVLTGRKVQTSCGYGVPRLSSAAPNDPEKVPEAAFEDRETIGHWASNKVEKNELLSYQTEWNSNSLDGLTGLKSARREGGEVLWLGDIKASVRRVLLQREALMAGMFIGILMALVARLTQALLI